MIAVRDTGDFPQGAQPDDGRIPFRLRIGVTGHRRIAVDCKQAVFDALDCVLKHLIAGAATGPINTAIQLAVVSQLAEGADRIVAGHVSDYAAVHGRDVRLEVVLPMERRQYVQSQRFSHDSRVEFERLLAFSTFTIEPTAARLTTHKQRADAYAAAGRKMIARCDVLIALWDGKPAPDGRGGTAHTLLTAAALGKPCIWIPVASDGQAEDNFTTSLGRAFFERIHTLCGSDLDTEVDDADLEDRPLESLQHVLLAFDEYNCEPRRYAGLSVAAGRRRSAAEALVDRTFGRRADTRMERALERGTVARSAAGTPLWLAAPSQRASALAAAYRRWFKRVSTAVVVTATLAAAALGAGVAVKADSPVWATLEFSFLIVTLLSFITARGLELHQRWLSYRLLAERFRTARYLAPVGVDFREQARLRDIEAGGRQE